VALPAGNYSSLSQLGGALLQSSSTDLLDADLFYKCGTSSRPVLTIATGAVTAGKFRLIFDCVQV
jgi:hypothetical protein